MITDGLGGKVAIVTGAAGGIGAATARMLAEAGASVVLTDVKQSEGEQAAAAIGDQARFIGHDVTNACDWNTVIAFAQDIFGAVSILINNAGIAVAPTPLDEVREEDFRRVFEVNQLSCFLGMKAIVPSMRRAGGGAIVNVSSVAGLKAEAGAIAYTASKFAVTGMTKVAALDLAKDNIRVNSVHPGLIDTPMVRPAANAEAFEPILQFAAGLPVPRPGRPEEVASLITFLVSDAAGYCTGGAHNADGGWLL